MGSKIQLKEQKEEKQTDQYKEDIRRRKGMEPRNKKLVYLLIAAACLYIVFLVVPLPVPGAWDQLSSNHMSPAEYNIQFKQNIQNIGYILSGQDVGWSLGYEETLALKAKLGEMLCGIGALAVGAGLSVTGAVFQGSFRNSIASPTTLGVMSGGTLGSTVYIMWGYDWFHRNAEGAINYTGFERFIFVLIGCFGAVLFTTSLARMTSRGKSISMVSLIVVGMVFSTAVSTISQYISMMVNATDPYGSKAAALQTAMAGYINDSATWLLVIVVGAVLAILILMSKRLNLMVFGEDEARAMGINVDRDRKLMMALCTILTAVIIAACGGISFVGLIIPHIARRVVGSDFRYLVSGCAVIGGMFLLICHWLPPFSWMATQHVGNYTSIVGGIVFLFMIIRNRRKSNADWA